MPQTGATRRRCPNPPPESSQLRRRTTLNPDLRGRKQKRLRKEQATKHGIFMELRLELPRNSGLQDSSSKTARLQSCRRFKESKTARLQYFHRFKESLGNRRILSPVPTRCQRLEPTKTNSCRIDRNRNPYNRSLLQCPSLGPPPPLTIHPSMETRSTLKNLRIIQRDPPQRGAKDSTLKNLRITPRKRIA